MPAQKPKPDDIWNKKITFFSIDTDILQRKGFQFRSGALNQLPHQLPESMELLFSPIVEEEVMKHRRQNLSKAVEQLESATNAIQRASGIPMQCIDSAAADLNIISTAMATFRNDLDDFVSRCNGRILSINKLDASVLFADYFSQKPPFEEGKKSEFPDAATLQLLQDHAEENDTIGIMVSADGGCEKYAENSDRLYCFKSLDELTELFVATGRSADEVAVKIKDHLARCDSVLNKAIEDAIKIHIADAEWDTSGFSPDIGDRMEMEIYGADINSIKLSDDIEIWRDKDDDEFWIMEVTACVTVRLDAQADLYKWDSVDREEMRLASVVSSFIEEVEIRLYVRMANVRLDKAPEEWTVDVEVDEASSYYRLGSSEFHFDLR